MSRSGPITRDASTVQLGLSQIRISKSLPYIGNTSPALLAADSLGAMASTSFTSETEYWDLESGFPLSLDATFPLSESNIIECAFKEITPKSLALARGMDPFSDISASVAVLKTLTSAGGYVDGDLSVDNAGGAVTDVFSVIFTSATAFDVHGMVSGMVGSGTISSEFAPDNGGNPYFTIPANHFTGTWAAGESQNISTTAFSTGDAGFGDAHVGSVALGSLQAPKYLRVEAVYTFPDASQKMAIIFPRANITSSLNLDQQAEDAAAVSLTIKSMGASEETEGGDAVWNNMPNGQILFYQV